MTACLAEIQVQETETENDQSRFHYLWLKFTTVVVNCFSFFNLEMQQDPVKWRKLPSTPPTVFLFNIFWISSFKTGLFR